MKKTLEFKWFKKSDFSFVIPKEHIQYLEHCALKQITAQIVKGRFYGELFEEYLNQNYTGTWEYR
jgi:hypothetical protein